MTSINYACLSIGNKSDEKIRRRGRVRASSPMMEVDIRTNKRRVTLLGLLGAIVVAILRISRSETKVNALIVLTIPSASNTPARANTVVGSGLVRAADISVFA